MWHGPLNHWCREGKTLVVRPLKKNTFYVCIPLEGRRDVWICPLEHFSRLFACFCVMNCRDILGLPEAFGRSLNFL